MGDARTGGKGSQRRKVKVVSKPTVISLHHFREATIRLSRTSSRKWVPNNWESTKSTSSETTTPYSTSSGLKLTPPFKITLSSSQANLKPRPSRTCFRTSSNNLVPSNTSICKNWFNKSAPHQAKKFQTWSNQNLTRCNERTNDSLYFKRL